MNDADHFLTSNYLSLSEDQKEALHRYISVLHSKPVTIGDMESRFLWIVVFNCSVHVRSTLNCHDFNLISKQELLECVAMGMLI